MSTPEVDPSTQAFSSPEWIRNSGGFLHSNNVLFYFAMSPFFDQMSTNNTVFIQAVGNPQREFMHLSTRQRFEAELQNHLGIQYVVDSDPLESQAKIKTPGGVEEQSDIWIIRKQDRKQLGQAGELVPLEYYYIANQTIFQAPRLDNIFNYRLTNVSMELDKMLSKVAALPHFTPSHGYPFYKDNQKSATTNVVSESQPSRADTPAIDESTTGQEGDSSVQNTGQQSDDRTLLEALRMTMRYGTQYYDDAPLIGEPGNFRYSKTRDPVQGLKQAEAANAKSGITSKAGTPSSTPAIKQSPAPTSGVLVGNGVDSTKPKPKRKKSMAINES